MGKETSVSCFYFFVRPCQLTFGFLSSPGHRETLDCTGSHRYHARGTAYYPADNPLEGGFNDMHGHPLQTLQVN